jgi:hypothetical protein
MRLLAWIAIALLAACSKQTTITLYQKPCLYPMYEYNFSVCKDYPFKVDNDIYVVPEGFVTDLASIPRILWPLYAPNHVETIPAAVIHDYLYFCPGNFSRQDVDYIFYQALINEGIKTSTALKYWLAVRTFGWRYFQSGADCIHGYTRTKNTNGGLRMAYHATSEVS